MCSLVMSVNRLPGGVQHQMYIQHIVPCKRGLQQSLAEDIRCDIFFGGVVRFSAELVQRRSDGSSSGVQHEARNPNKVAYGAFSAGASMACMAVRRKTQKCGQYAASCEEIHKNVTGMQYHAGSIMKLKGGFNFVIEPA